MVITIGREFGSGGRELGRRLAAELGIDYYDKEILTEIAKSTDLSEQYIKQTVEGKMNYMYPITIGHSLTFTPDYQIKQVQEIYKAQTETIRELAAKSDCVIIGRCADYILRDMKPFRIFVYADIDARVQRCMDRREEGDTTTAAEMKKQIQRIDKDRARYYSDFTGQNWGYKPFYDICINTTDVDIKEFVHNLANMFRGQLSAAADAPAEEA